MIELLVLAMIVAMIAYAIWGQSRYRKWFAQDLPELEAAPCLGKLRDWEILGCKQRVVLASPYQNYPDGWQSVDDRWFVAMSPDQARELAGLIRLAAAPGQTLAEAEEQFAKMKRAA